MRRKAGFVCLESVEAAVECIAREAVLLQNLAEYGTTEDVDDRLRRLSGLSAAAHRGWREMNEQLSRTFLSAVEREDLSTLVREMAELTDALFQLAVLWRAAPQSGAASWTERLVQGSRLLREITMQLPLFRQDNTLADRAEELYDLRREADRQWMQESHRLHGRQLSVAAAFHDCCLRMARLADTIEWLVLKNT